MGGGGGVRGGRIENIYTLDYSPLALTGSFLTLTGSPAFFPEHAQTRDTCLAT